MRQHGENALRIAEYLLDHAAVKRVFYPGLPDDFGHVIAQRNFASGAAADGTDLLRAQRKAGYGGMVSFLARDGAAARRIVARTRIFTLAESLGGVESLIEHPGAMTHASLAGSSIEIDPALVRLSVGIEDCDDLIADLAQALEVHGG